MTLLYLVSAWVAGIFLAPAASPPSLWLAMGGMLLVAAIIRRQERNQRLMLMYTACFMLGAARLSWETQPLSNSHIARIADTGYATLTGTISRDPDVRDNHINLRITVETVRLDTETKTAHGVILAQAPRHGNYHYGDQVLVSGTLLTPPEFDDFSYRDYLARRGVHILVPNAEVTVLSSDQGNPLFSALYDVKNRAQRTIDRLLPSPEAPLLSGILLGVETAIPDYIREDFNRTGTAHIIAISGANIIVVISISKRLLTPLVGTRMTAWLTLSGVAGYTLFVGADPAVVRAAIMGSLALVAVQGGRRTHGLTSLAFAIWLMTLWNPNTLWDVGFQLSVAATAGLVIFVDDLTRYAENLLARAFAQDTARQVTRWLSEPVIVSFAAQITTTPLILLYFGRLSLVSFLANVLIVPVQSVIMIGGWLAVLVGMVWTPFGEPLAWLTYLPLHYTISIVRQLGAFDWASLDVQFTTTYAWLIYAALLSFAWIRIQHPDDRQVWWHTLQRRATTVTLLLAGAAVAILVWLTAHTQPDGKLHVWFLDVGHGHAVLLRTPDGAHILVDGGPNPTRLRGTLGDAIPFYTDRLDLLIVTQPRTSTINALPALVNRYDVQQALTNGHIVENDALTALFDTLQAHDVPVATVTAGYQIVTGDGVHIDILHPQTLPSPSDDVETQAMILRVTYGDTSFLLTPVLDEQTIDLVRQGGWYLASTVLELPSYGHARVNTESFLATVRPQVAAVGIGAGNRSGLPASETQKRLSAFSTQPLFRTDHHGTIHMVTDGLTLDILTDH